MFDRSCIFRLFLGYLVASLVQPYALGKASYKVSEALTSPRIQVAAWVADATIEKPRIAAKPDSTSPKGRTIAVTSVLGAEVMTVDAFVSSLPAAFNRAIANDTAVAANIAAAPNTSSVETLPTPGKIAVAAAQITVAAAKNTPAILTIQINMDKSISVFPETIALNKVGDSLRIEKRSLAGDSVLAGVSIFVRDGQIISLDANGQTVTALALGDSEIIAAGNGKLSIAKVRIGTQPLAGLENLEVPAELTAFIHPSGPAMAQQQTERASRSISSSPMSLEESKRKAQETLENYVQQSKQFARESLDVGYKEVVLQLLDERSIPSQGVIFPVGGVTVTLVGTGFTGETSATGHFTIPNVPTKSHLLIAVSDKRGAYMPMISEISTDESGDSQLIQLPALRSFTFENSAAVAGTVQRETLGSLCATVYDESGSTVEGAVAVPDESVDGPYFFNRYGFLDRTLQATGPNGRFCMFNITAGPLAIEISQAKSFSGLVPIAVFSGQHVEEEFLLNNKGKIHTRLAAMATVHEQLSNDPAIAGAYRSIDMVDLIPLGEDDALRQMESGLAVNHYPLMDHNDRIFALSRASEFEPTVYSYGIFDNSGVGEHLTPLIPRGFVEDMAIFAQVTLDLDLGTVVAEHGDVNGQTQGAIKLKLLDERGNPAGQGWYYGDSPVTKAVFFNVNPGKYLVMAETSDGYWLAVDTILVYSRTVSYVRTGARTRYR